jgi:hypothetical protein
VESDIEESDIEEFAALDTLDMGVPISCTRNSRQHALGMLRFYAGMATALHGERLRPMWCPTISGGTPLANGSDSAATPRSEHAILTRMP